VSMYFKIDGVNAITRNPMSLEIVAESERDAWSKADSRGMIPHTVVEYHPLTEEQLRATDEAIARKRFSCAEPCARCGEGQWDFLSISPTKQSAAWQCAYCKKKVIIRDDSTTVSRPKFPRQPIPRDVQREVWRRDEGQCVRCKRKEKLEYDHIIPLSKGGSNTVRNLQLLCENCNRGKSNSIG
jgi:5-methylcytosine-specific restriction endonuclease McrA